MFLTRFHLPSRNLFLLPALMLVACATSGQQGMAVKDTAMFSQLRSSEHRAADDDLLTGGLGLDGLRIMVPPEFADAQAPTPAELRRRALWSSWRGIADLAPGGGYAEIYGSVARVPGREFHAYARVPGANQPHRVMVQLPDTFDTDKPCMVVTASSGSRGIYGSIAIAGAWGLPKGCAVAYTDKGAGADYFDLDAQMGHRADGTLVGADGNDALAFVPDAPVGASGIAFKHAHSKDNPEADWGRHVRQAAQFGLNVLNQAYPDRNYGFDDVRVIAVGVSNGGGAVLRAAEDNDDWLDAVVAGEPNVLVNGVRPLYDITTEAALLMPCALPVLGIPPVPYADARCATLNAAGLVNGDDPAAQRQSAYDSLRKGGWTDEALRAASMNVAFDLWRGIGATYASAYGRYGVDGHPCGYRYAVQDAQGRPRAATASERAAWWSEGSGIPPGNAIALLDPKASDGADPAFAGLTCLRALWDGQDSDANRVRKGIAELHSATPRPGLPVIVVHGSDDGLVPLAFTSAPYVAAAKAAGREHVRFWEVRHAQHFDAILGLPIYAAQYVPLLPYVYAALDRAWAHLDSDAALPADATIDPIPRGTGKPLDLRNLAIPETPGAASVHGVANESVHASP